MCWRAAYNDGYAMWVVENTPLAKPQLIATDASSYADGVITFHERRGIVDCVNGEERVWDGRTFVQSLKYTTGMCREITLAAPGCCPRSSVRCGQNSRRTPIIWRSRRCITPC